jgi:hypothetical protein
MRREEYGTGHFFRGLALARRLEQPQPLADIRFGTLIALPLILDFQPCPLLGIEGL